MKRRFWLITLIVIIIVIVWIGTNMWKQEKGSEEKTSINIGRYRDIYEEAYKTQTLGSLETMEDFINCVGAAGYPAVDYENQIDMVRPEEVEDFCERVKERKNGAVTVFVVLDNGGYVQYDFRTEDGKVDVEQNSLFWEDGAPQKGEKREYPANTWIYSEKGYLFFEESKPKGYDSPSGHTAIRVKPLDEMCREMNRKYVLPVGYNRNNMFITDWEEGDWGELNFYDLYEIMYEMKYKEQIDFDFEDMSKISEIPKAEFETVFQTYFQIDSDTLKDKTTFYKENETYAYRPRGLYERSATSCPRPEVVDYTENEDGTISLTIDAVWWERNLERAFSHILTIRLLEEGGFQYISNHVIPAEENEQPVWYTKRRPL